MKAEIFHVEWCLLPESEELDASPAVFTPERLLAMASNLFKIPASSFNIIPSGFTHPYFEELMLFLLGNNAPVSLTFVIDDYRTVSPFEHIMRRANKGQIKLYLLHAGDRELITTQMSLYERAKGHGINAILVPDKNAEQIWILKSLRQTIPFDALEPVSGNEARRAAVSAALSSFPLQPPSRHHMGAYCSPGSVYMRIMPNGHFFNSPCPQALDFGSLWEASEQSLKDFGALIQCRQAGCPCADIVPRFPNADAWQQVLPARSPYTPKIMERMAALNRVSEKEDVEIRAPIPEIIVQNSTQIETVYDTLADIRSKVAFLHSIKALETGDSSWLNNALKAEDLDSAFRIKPGDVPFTRKGRYCSHFAPKHPVANIQELVPTFNLHKPQIRLPLSQEQIITVPMSLLELGYDLFWGNDAEHSGVIYARHPAHSEPLPLPEIVSGRVSVQLSYYNNEDTLARCLDSVLMQDVDDLEIIIIDDGSSDGSARIVGTYKDLYPRIIRWRRLDENKGLGYGRNLGMSMASGEYITFVDADDALAPGFLKKALSLMQAKKADIASFAMLQMQVGKASRIGLLEQGEYAGEAALAAFLLKKAGHYGSVSKVYRSAFLRENRIRFGSTVVSEDLSFNLNAFMNSGLAVVVPDLGYLRYNRPGTSHSSKSHGVKDIVAFGSAVKIAEDLFEAFELAKSRPEFKYFTRRIYTWARGKTYDAILKIKDYDTISDALRNIGSSREALALILEDYANALYGKGAKLPLLLPEDRDWKKSASEPWPIPAVTAYGRANDVATPAPILSVIVPCYNAGECLAPCLRSILKQSFHDFELIVVDDASTDGSLEVLKDFAATDSRIRLYGLGINCRQGIARNIGVQKARGEYIIFVDADDICLPEYFSAALEAIKAEGADMAVFGSQLETEDHGTWDRTILGDGRLTRSQALAAFWRRELQPEPWAKIFRTDLIKGHRLEFPPYVYHQDVPFIFSALNASQSVATRSQYVYRRVYSKNSTIRPTNIKYLHLHSAYHFYGFINRALGSLRDTRDYPGDEAGEPFIQWNIENVLLPKIASYRAAGEQLPLSEEDYGLLRDNQSFLIALLKGAATAYLKKGRETDRLSCRSRPSRVWEPRSSDAPLVSVIVPVCNNEDSLNWMVRTILTQSFPDFELIFVVSNSQDNSLHFCKQFARSDGRIRVIEYSGADPLSEGVRQARGKYITFGKANGIFAPDFLMAAVSELERQADAGATFFATATRGDFSDLKPNHPGKFNSEDMSAIFDQKQLNHPALHGALWRMDVIESLGAQGVMPDNGAFALAACVAAGKVIVDARPGWSSCMARETDAEIMRKALDQQVYWEKLFSEGNRMRYYREYFQSLVKDLEHQWLPYINTSPIPRGSLTSRQLMQLREMPVTLFFILKECATKYIFRNQLKPDLIAACETPADTLLPVSQTRGGSRQPAVSVIIPIYNEGAALKKGLLADLNRLDESVEIIVIEDNSEDSSPERLKAISQEIAKRQSGPAFRIFRTPWRAGKAIAWNLGMKAAQADFVIFGELGSELPQWVSRLSAAELDTADVWLAGNIGADPYETIALHFYGENSNPVFRKSFLEENDIRFNDMDKPAPLHLLRALLAARRVLDLPYPSVPLLYSALDEKVSETSFRSIFDLHAAMLKLLDKGPEATQAAWANWFLAPGSGLFHIIMLYLAAKREWMPDPGLIRIFMENDIFLQYLIRKIASIYAGSKK